LSSFLEVIDRAQALLKMRGRISLRALRREFSLDDDALEDLADELVEVQQVASREGDVLSWLSGATAREPEPPTEVRDSLPAVHSDADVQADAHSNDQARRSPASARPDVDTSERRQLTVMFCDLVGSTELAQRIDPEDLRDVLREYQRVCVGAAERVGGYVAQYLGDGVLIYFGYPQAHEDAATRAIRAGLEIQHILGGRLQNDPIEARIGIHTGLVVVDPSGTGDDALALGPTTNIAARIEAAAKPGTVVISDATLRLCRGGFVTRSLGAVELKGVQEPVLLHVIEAMAGVRSGLEVASSKPMVGRDRELGLALDRWQDALEGRGQVVLISGEAGMGKSRLIQGLHDDLTKRAHLWIDMQCSPFTSGSAFQPLLDLQTAGFSLNEAASPEEAREILVQGIEVIQGLQHEEVIPYMLALLSLPPSERYPMIEMSPEKQRELTFVALAKLMLTMSELQPVILVAEDLHWSDPSTLEYLGRLIDQAATARLMLVLTSRPEFRAPWSQSHVTEIKLSRLSKGSTRDMISNAAGGQLPESVLAELELRSDGVPLFVDELTANVVSSGVMIERAGNYELRGNLRDLAIPATLQDSLMARLDRLSASKQVAQQAATLGREFSYELIEAITQLDTPSLRGALSQLVTAEILHQRGALPEASYTFRHALLQDTAYESLLFSTRRMLHARIAEVLEERFPARVESEPETMAHHCAAAGLNDRAVDHYQRAAELAVERLSNLEAAEHYGLALAALASLAEDDDRHQKEIALRLAQANALMVLHSYDSPDILENIARVTELSQMIGEGPQQLPALLGLVQFDMQRGDNLNSRDRAEAILRIAEPLGVQQLIAAAHYIIGGTDMIIGSSIDARNRLAKTVAIAQEAEFPPPATPHDLDLLGLAHATHALALASCGETEQAMQALAASRERVTNHGNDNSLVQSTAMMSLVGHLMGEPELARSAGDESLSLGEGRGFHTAQVMATVCRGWGRALLGEIEAGIQDVERGLEITEATGSLAGVALLCVAAADVHIIAKNRERAEALLDKADAIIEQRGESQGYAHRVMSSRARLELKLGDGSKVAATEAMLLDAIERAHTGDLLLDEIGIATQLAQLAPRTGRVREAQDRLTKIYSRFSEGFDRPGLLAAKAAIDEQADA
jgi:class 3 adenylate cyclase/tetratricopeptide (TPR) repeat protein